jgi:TonB-dependent SusC/RagA subfamily outer membrane receptor
MLTFRSGSSAQWLVIAATVAATGCATQPAPLAMQQVPLAPNVRLIRPAPIMTVAEAPAPSRGDIPLAESARYGRIDELLIARAPGLDVRQLGNGRFSLFVRNRSLSDRNEALVVIDGMQYGRNGSEALGSVTPRDVKRVDVLKDASATAVYGSQGASGVVVITTRRGDY